MKSDLFPRDLQIQQWVEFPASGYAVPVTGVIYDTDHLQPVCGMPLGGIATGALDLQTDGTFGLCTLFRRVWGWDERDRVYTAGNATRDLPADETRLHLNMPFLGLAVDGQATVLTTKAIDGVAIARQIRYWGHYPMADLQYELAGPVEVSLRAWAPFLPGDTRASSMPGAVFEVYLKNTDALPHQLTVAMNFTGPDGPRGMVAADGLYGVSIADDRQQYVLAALNATAVRCGGGLGRDGAAWAQIANQLPDGESGASVTSDLTLAAGEERIVRFVLTWWAPDWESDFPYGEMLQRYSQMYETFYPSALAVAQQLAANYAGLLQRIIAWQSAIYTSAELPGWLRDQLVNSFHLLAEVGFWAQAKSPIPEWVYQGGIFSLVEGTDAAGQQSCLPCDWFGNLPLVYCFPELAWSTLRAYRMLMREDGAAPFYFGQGLDMVCTSFENGTPEGVPWIYGQRFAHHRQRTLNGCVYTDIVDRLWQCTGDDEVLHEFYPTVKQSTIFSMTLDAGPDGIISAAGDHWYESMAWPGMTAQVGSVRLAHLRIAERLAEAVGDVEFAQQCRDWFAQGSRSMEKLWAGEAYLLYKDEQNGTQSDMVMAFQLDGEWMAHAHGVPTVLPADYVETALATIARLNGQATRAGAINVIGRDGTVTEHGGRMGGRCVMPASVYILAATYLYQGQAERGLTMAHQCCNAIVNELGLTWDQPNMFRADEEATARIYGTDYYQVLSLWALPAALAGQTLTGPSQEGGLVQRVLSAGKAEKMPCG